MTKTKWCWSLVGVVGALAWGAGGSIVIAQDTAAPDLERAAAAEVRRREVAAGVERGGLVTRSRFGLGQRLLMASEAVASTRPLAR